MWGLLQRLLPFFRQIILAYWILRVLSCLYNMTTPVTQRQPTRQRQQTLLKSISISSHRNKIFLSGNNLPRINLIRGKLFPDRCLHPIHACWFQLRLLLSVALIVTGYPVCWRNLDKGLHRDNEVLNSRVLVATGFQAITWRHDESDATQRPRIDATATSFWHHVPLNYSLTYFYSSNYGKSCFISNSIPVFYYCFIFWNEKQLSFFQ